MCAGACVNIGLAGHNHARERFLTCGRLIKEALKYKGKKPIQKSEKWRCFVLIYLLMVGGEGEGSTD